MRILQIIVTTGAAIGAIVGAVKFFLKRIDRQIDDRMEPKIAILSKEHEDMKHELGLLKQSFEFFEKYFFEPLGLKRNKNQNKDRREKEDEYL